MTTGTTGRTVATRNNVKSGYCQRCGMRILVGEPSTGEGNWPAKLLIEEPMMDQLMRAAAEFRDLCDECANCQGECLRRSHTAPCVLCGCETYRAVGWANAVDFVDWLWPTATAEGFASPITLSAERTMDRAK